MEKNNKLRYDALATILKAISHPSRLLMLEEIAKKTTCVSDLTIAVGADTSTVSKHLSIMKNAGIIESKKNGNQVFYSLRVPCIINFLNCIDSIIIKNVEDKMEILNTLQE